MTAKSYTDWSEEELARRFLELSDIPAADHGRQIDHVASLGREVLVPQIELLERTIAETGAAIEAVADEWLEEEEARDAIRIGSHDEIVDWLRESLDRRFEGHAQPFVPFQDIVPRSDYQDGLYQLFLSLDYEQQEVWTEAIATLSTAALTNRERRGSLRRLLDLTQRVDALPLVAVKHDVELALIERHALREIELRDSMLVDLAERALMKSAQSLPRAIRIVDGQLDRIYRKDGVSDAWLEKLGDRLVIAFGETTVIRAARKMPLPPWLRRTIGKHLRSELQLTATPRRSGLVGRGGRRVSPDLLRIATRNVVASASSTRESVAGEANG